MSENINGDETISLRDIESIISDSRPFTSSELDKAVSSLQLHMESLLLMRQTLNSAPIMATDRGEAGQEGTSASSPFSLPAHAPRPPHAMPLTSSLSTTSPPPSLPHKTNLSRSSLPLATAPTPATPHPGPPSLPSQASEDPNQEEEGWTRVTPSGGNHDPPHPPHPPHRKQPLREGRSTTGSLGPAFHPPPPLVVIPPHSSSRSSSRDPSPIKTSISSKQPLSPEPNDTGSSPEGSLVKVRNKGGVAWKAKVEWRSILASKEPRPLSSLSPHSPLSSDLRPKRSPQETKQASEERHARAVQIREALAVEKRTRLSKYNQVREEAVRSSSLGKGEFRVQVLSKVEEKLARSAELRQQHLDGISQRAGEESRKVAEVAFINQIVGEDKRVSLQQKLEEEEARLKEKRRNGEVLVRAKGSEKAKEEEEVQGRRKEQEQVKARELEDKLALKAQREERVLARLEEERRAQLGLREAMRERQALTLGQMTAELKRQQEALGERIEERLREAALRRQSRLELIRDRAALATTGLATTPPSSPGRLFSPKIQRAPLSPSHAVGAEKRSSEDEGEVKVKRRKHLSASAVPFTPSAGGESFGIPSVKAPQPQPSSSQPSAPLRSTDGSITAARSAVSRLRGMRKRAAKISSLLKSYAESYKASSEALKAAADEKDAGEKKKFMSSKSISSAVREWKVLVKACYAPKKGGVDHEDENVAFDDGGVIIIMGGLNLVPLGSPPLSSLLSSIQSVMKIEEDIEPTASSRIHSSRIIRWVARPLGVIEIITRLASSPYPDESSSNITSESASQVIRARRTMLHCLKVLATATATASSAQEYENESNSHLSPSLVIDLIMDFVSNGLAPVLSKSCMKELDACNSISPVSQPSASSPSKRQSPKAVKSQASLIETEDPPLFPPTHLTLTLDILSLILHETREFKPPTASPSSSLHSLLVSLLLSSGLVGRSAEMLSLMDGPSPQMTRVESGPSSPSHSRKMSGGSSVNANITSLSPQDTLTLTLTPPPPHPLPRHIMAILSFLNELTSSVKADGAVKQHSLNPNAPALSLALQETSLAGLPSLLTAVLLTAAPSCKPSEAILDRLPDNFCPAATLVMRSLNNAARLDLPSLQSSLSGSNGLGVEFLHLSSFLLSFCSTQVELMESDTSSAAFNDLFDLLFELLLLISHFAVGNAVNQSMLTWGRSVTYSVIHCLCSLPLEAISHPSINKVWTSCLVVASDDNPRVRDLVLSYCSPQWLKAGLRVLSSAPAEPHPPPTKAAPPLIDKGEKKAVPTTLPQTAKASYAKVLTQPTRGKYQNVPDTCTPSLHSDAISQDQLVVRLEAFLVPNEDRSKASIPYHARDVESLKRHFRRSSQFF